MTAKADGEAFIMDGFVRRKGGAGDRMEADGVERFRILTRKRKKYREDYWEVDAKELNLHYESLI